MEGSKPNPKIPPQNLEAEQSVLGAVLLSREALHEVVQHVKPEDFYKNQHQLIYNSILALDEKNEAIDILTLVHELSTRKELELAGGPAYISRLTSIVPSAANAVYYAELVKETSTRRRLLDIGGHISEQIFDPSLESNEIIETAEQRLFEITDSQSRTQSTLIRDLIAPAFQVIEEQYKNKGAYSGIPSGFDELDRMTAGFQKSELIIIGARPSMGKTALALSMIANMAFRGRDKYPVGFFSLEMSSIQIVMRLIAMEAQVDAQRVRTGMLSMSDLKDMSDAASVMYDSQVVIESEPNINLLDLRAQARKMKSRNGIQILFIDYLSLITYENKKIPRHEQVAEISRSLKALARELQIPIIALAQVKRDTEGKEPGLSDLRESSALEQDADMVIFLHRERTSTNSDNPDAPLPAKLIVAKQRNGPIGDIQMGFRAKFTRFVSLTTDHN